MGGSTDQERSSTEDGGQAGGRQSEQKPQGSGERRERRSLERTQFANERTFLSWVRTAITSIVLGLVVSQFYALNIRRGRSLVLAAAIALIVAGIYEAIAGQQRYFLNLKGAQAGRFGPATSSTYVTVILTVIAGIISLALVLLLSRS